MINKTKLIEWLKLIRIAAEADKPASIWWFLDTVDDPFCIIAGWQEGFEPEDDLYLHSKSEPQYCMCVKVALNGHFAYTEYELMNMPYDEESGDVYDTEVALCKEDDLDLIADELITYWKTVSELYTNNNF